VRKGFKIYDTDTHIGPTAETIRPYLSSLVLERVPDLEEHRVPIRTSVTREPLQPPYRHFYRFRGGNEEAAGFGVDHARYLGEAAPRTEKAERPRQFMGTRWPTHGCDDDAAEARLRDMDDEGVDVHFMIGGAGSSHPDHVVGMEFIRAGHRYLNDFCGQDPHRLKASISVVPWAIEESIQEIKSWAPSPWAVAIHPHLPVGYPLDHPDLNPVWAAAQEHGLAVIHHSFSAGYPGHKDLWDNPFLARLAAHPWGAMRAMGAFFGAGIMDRFPHLRFGILESGFGWLPFWARRMDDQAVYMGYVNEDLEYRMSEYVTGGRFFASVVLHEGEDMVRMVTEDLGDHILTFSSDYPHPESRFPGSADIALEWTGLGEDRMHKLLWENPVRFFGEP
jgi:predicted TIM-barrel fold metal-dependent hydrolase